MAEVVADELAALAPLPDVSAAVPHAPNPNANNTADMAAMVLRTDIVLSPRHPSDDVKGHCITGKGANPYPADSPASRPARKDDKKRSETAQSGFGTFFYLVHPLRRIAIDMTDSKKPSAPKEKPFVPIADRPLLGVPEAAALTGLDEKIIRLTIRQGELIACYAGSSTKRIRRRDLDDWISSLPERPQ